MILRAEFRHVGAEDHPLVLTFEGQDAGRLLRQWQEQMESFVRQGFRTLTCVCRFV